MASTPNQVSMRSSTKRPDAQPLNTSSKRFRLGEQQPPIQRQLPINSYTSASQHGQSSYGFETLNPHTTVAPIELDMPSNNIQHESTWTNTPFNTNNNFTFYQGPMGGETEDDGRHEQGNVPMSPVASADGNQAATQPAGHGMIETREVDGIRTVVLTEELVRALELVTRMMPVLQDLDQIVGTPAMISINDRLEIQNEQLQRLEHGEFHLLRRARRLEGIVMQKQNPA